MDSIYLQQPRFDLLSSSPCTASTESSSASFNEQPHPFGPQTEIQKWLNLSKTRVKLQLEIN